MSSEAILLALECIVPLQTIVVADEQVLTFEIPVSNVQAVQVLDGLARIVKEVSSKFVRDGTLFLTNNKPR